MFTQIVPIERIEVLKTAKFKNSSPSQFWQDPAQTVIIEF